MDTFFCLYFHFCLELRSQSFFNTFSMGLWPNHTHSLVSFQWSGFSKQRVLCLTKNCLQIRKWCPNKGRGVVSAPICANKVRNGSASANQGWAKATTMCTAYVGFAHPTPPIQFFFPSTKPISKTIICLPTYHTFKRLITTVEVFQYGELTETA